MNCRNITSSVEKDSSASESLLGLQADLLVYIADDIERLSKLPSTDIVKKKIEALSYYENLVRNTQSILDLIILANEILADSRITKQRNIGNGVTDVERNILGFLLTAYNTLSIPVASEEKNESGWFDILAFTDQMQLTNVLDCYIANYQKSFKEYVLPGINNRRMTISQDNAVVIFDLEGTIMSDDQDSRIKDWAIGRIIISRIIDLLGT